MLFLNTHRVDPASSRNKEDANTMPTSGSKRSTEGNPGRLYLASEMTGDQGMVETSTWVQVFLMASRPSSSSNNDTNDSEAPSNNEAPLSLLSTSSSPISSETMNSTDLVATSNKMNNNGRIGSVLDFFGFDGENSSFAILTVLICVFSVIAALCMVWYPSAYELSNRWIHAQLVSLFMD